MIEQTVSSGEEQQATRPAESARRTVARPPEEICDAESLLGVLRAGGAWLDRHVEAVNALNVFPVPDGDTGTNMSLTMRAALAEIDSTPLDSASRVARVISDGALMGARGNSGVILSQVLRGFARALDGKVGLSPREFAQALQEGAATAYKGVMKPVEGTMLTVAREAAEAAHLAASGGATMEQTLAAALTEAQASLDRTPGLLPVLAEAGVVDAGGRGLVCIFEGALRHIRGESTETADETGPSSETDMEPLPEPGGQYNYDTQFIIKGQGLDVERIRDAIADLGDSVLVVGDSETVKVHVHCDHPGVALDYGISQGHVTGVIIDNMQLQYEAFMASRQRTAGEPSSSNTSAFTMPPIAVRPMEPPAAISVIAVASGDGLSRVLKSLGVNAVVTGGQTMNPSTQDIVQAIEQVPGERVILLPNNANVILAAQQARELSSKPVVVVPTRTIPQGIAALLAMNYQADIEENADLMVDAMGTVSTGEITTAVRSAQVNGLTVREGQIIGLLDDDLKTAGDTEVEVLTHLLDLMDTDDCEILTLYYGQGMTEADANALREVALTLYPHLEVEVVDGGQAHYHYIISAE